MTAIAGDGVACAARRAGGRGEAIVFVHGVGSNAQVWDGQLADFGNDYQCLAVDVRGNGVAPVPHDLGAITRAGFVRDVLAIADAAGVQRFHYVGCSMGGVIGFELWRTAPQRVQSLTLVDTFAAYPDGHAHAARIEAALAGVDSLKAFAEQRAQALLPPNPDPARLAQTIDHMTRKSVAAYRAATQATWTGDYRSLLATIDVPALVVWGEFDNVITPRALSDELVRGIPGAKFALIAGAGHVASADQPAAFNAAVRNFYNGAHHD